jgi:hypothetical protein
MRIFWYFVDVLNAIGTALIEGVSQSPLKIILFIPFIAFLIPLMIYISEKQRKGEKVDYTW